VTTTRQPSDADRSIARLVSDLSEQTTRLAKVEAQLAARETAAKAKRAGLGVGAFAVAGFVAGLGSAVLIACLILALDLVMPAWTAALLVGVALSLTAGLVALIAKSQLRKAMPPVPQDAIARVREDIEVVRERTHE
jgi:membrane protein